MARVVDVQLSHLLRVEAAYGICVWSRCAEG